MSSIESPKGEVVWVVRQNRQDGQLARVDEFLTDPEGNVQISMETVEFPFSEGLDIEEIEVSRRKLQATLEEQGRGE